MDNIVNTVVEYFPMILQALGAVVLVATAIVKLTPSPKDDLFVESVGNKFLKLVSYLPSIGINPRTKKIEEAYKEISGKAKA